MYISYRVIMYKENLETKSQLTHLNRSFTQFNSSFRTSQIGLTCNRESASL